MKRDDLLHPLLPSGWTVWVDVHALRHLRVGLAGDDPPTVVELVPVVVRGHNVQEEDVFRLLVKAGDFKLQVRKHLPARKKRNKDFKALVCIRIKACIIHYY